MRRVRLPGGGRKSSIPIDIQNQLLEYLDCQREIENKVTVQMLVIQLRKLDDAYSNVKRGVLRRRIWRVLHGNKVSIRRATHQAQNTRLCDKVIADWVVYIKQKLKITGISHECFANFDETPVFFSPDASVTLNRKGSRTVSVRKAGSSERCTAMLGVSGDGHKFPPFVIFKGSVLRSGRIGAQLRKVATEQATSTDGEHLGFPLSNFYSVQPKAWMDTERMLEWVDKVWKPWTLSKGGRPTMLILDEFSAHMTDEVRRAYAACGTFLELVPGGYTSRLQVMDVGVNKPFKDRVRDQYDGWFMTVSTTVPSGTKPKRQDVATWIAKSWLDLPASAVANTWRRVGLPGNLFDGPDAVVEGEKGEGDFLDLGIDDEVDDENDYIDDGDDDGDLFTSDTLMF
jgi:hypothetical protein